ncbi:MAG: hypothetical protein LQ342_004611 [Letrouitia transgressa]|nr:MAG: hypothetical protein LQ342_004611 [Letrouitia transgressa]
MLNSKGSVAAAAAEQQLTQHIARAFNTGGPTSEASSELDNSSDHSSEYSSRSGKPLQGMAWVQNPVPHPSSGDSQQPMPYLASSYDTHQMGQGTGYQNAIRSYDHPEPLHSNKASSGGEAVKAFACQSCGKGFARRSDLARHERIHSGVRPHPFSDSSSLARHRRIHSGKRPYKCPFADCQKTFTRRTTLTRHQNHHTGTVEEAAAATAAALASRPPNLAQQTSSDGGTYSDTASGTSTPSPGNRNESLSPSSEIPRIPPLNRQSSDLSFLSGPLPQHLRHELQPSSLRSSPSLGSPTLSSFGPGPPTSSSQHRPSLTSHPAMYGPPPVLEPPANQDSRHSGSSGSSPHLSSVGWQSPIPGMGSPSRDSFTYPEPPYTQTAPHLYYTNSNLRRPQSTEPDQYETKPRLLPGEVWAGPL